MKAEIANVNKAMQVNLEHLDSGGNVKEIPNVFETIVLESPLTELITIEEPAEQEEVGSESKKSEPTEKESVTKNTSKKTQHKSESFWTLFIKWLSSPWNVSWRSLKSDEKKNN